MEAAERAAKRTGVEFARADQHSEKRQRAGGDEFPGGGAATETGRRKLRAQPVPSGICTLELEKEPRGERCFHAGSLGQQPLQRARARKTESHGRAPSAESVLNFAETAAHCYCI